MTIYTYADLSGGAIVSGSATANVSHDYVELSGGAKLSGVASTTKGKAFVCSGGAKGGGDVLSSKGYPTIVASGGIKVSGPNNALFYPSVSFKRDGYLVRSVPGVSSFGTDGAVVFDAWDSYNQEPLDTQMMIYQKVDEQLCTDGTKFTWAFRLNVSSVLENIPTSKWPVVVAIVNSDSKTYFTGDWRYCAVLVSADATGWWFELYCTNNIDPEYVDIYSLDSFSFDTDYRFVIHYDSTQSVEEDRVIVYQDGSLMPIDVGYSTYPPQNFPAHSSGTALTYNSHNIGAHAQDYSWDCQFVGTLYEVIYLDGLIKTDSELFGTAYSGPYPSSGSYHLKFLDPSNVGLDSSSNALPFIDYATVDEAYTPITFSGEATFTGYSSDKFTFKTGLWLNNVARGGANFNDVDINNFYLPLNTQCLEKQGHIGDVPLRFTFATRLIIDPRASHYWDDGDVLYPGVLGVFNIIESDSPTESYYENHFSVQILPAEDGDYNPIPGKFQVWLRHNDAGVILRLKLYTELEPGVPYRLVVIVNNSYYDGPDQYDVYIDGVRAVQQFLTGPGEIFRSIWNRYPGAYKAITVGGNLSTEAYVHQFFGILSDTLFFDGEVKYDEELYPEEGYYSGGFKYPSSFHLRYEDPNDIGKDSSPNNNHFTDAGSVSVDYIRNDPNKDANIYTLEYTPTTATEVTEYYAFGLVWENGYFLKSSLIDSTGVIHESIGSTEILPHTNTELQVSVDPSLSSSSDRVKLYVNSNLESLSGTPLYFPDNTSLFTVTKGFSFVINKVLGGITSLGKNIFGRLYNTYYLDGVSVSPDYFYQKNLLFGSDGFHLKYVTDISLDSSPIAKSFSIVNAEYVNDRDFNTLFVSNYFLELLQCTTPDVIGVTIKLVSGVPVTESITLEVLIDPQEIIVPLKLYGSGISVSETAVLKLVNTTLTSDINIVNSGTTATVTHTDHALSTGDQIIISNSDVVENNGVFTVVVVDPNTYTYTTLSAPAGNPTTVVKAITPGLWAGKWTAEASISGSGSFSLVESVTIENEEDSSAIATFYIAPTTGVIDPLVFIGKDVTLSQTQYDGGSVLFSYVRYSGKVATVVFDTDRKIIEITADTQLPAKFNAMTREEINSFIPNGIWSNQVWADEDDKSGWTYAQEVLSTTEEFLWTDSSGALRVSSLLAKSSPDFTFYDSQRFNESLSLEYAQRAEMLNTINIALEYSYERKKERQVSFRWSTSDGLCEFYLSCLQSTRGPYQLCQKSMVESAATSGTWVAISPISYTEVWPAGGYDCPCPGQSSTNSFVVWNYTTVSGFVNGSETSTDPVTGQTTTNEGFAYDAVVDASHLCIGASWTAAARWLQNVSEVYAITVKAPDSIEAIGVVSTTEEYSIYNEVDNSDWPNSVIPFKDAKPSGYKLVPGSNDTYYDSDESSEENTVNRTDFDHAQNVIISSARGDIIRAHRLNIVSFKTVYNPAITLDSTVRVVTPSLVAKGKVRRIVDTWDLSTGEASSEISIAISRHNGSGLVSSSDPVAPIPKPTPSIEPSLDKNIKLGLYKGGRATSPKYDEVAQSTWEGFLTNYLETLQPADYSVDSQANELLKDRVYPYSFVVRGPEITEEHTSTTETAADQSYLVSIPEDELVLTV